MVLPCMLTMSKKHESPLDSIKHKTHHMQICPRREREAMVKPSGRYSPRDQTDTPSVNVVSSHLLLNSCCHKTVRLPCTYADCYCAVSIRVIHAAVYVRRAIRKPSMILQEVRFFISMLEIKKWLSNVSVAWNEPHKRMFSQTLRQSSQKTFADFKVATR